MPSESFYFPHDYDASSDIRMVALLNRYGATGIGIYWMLVEMMHKDEACSISIGTDNLALLAGTMRIEEDALGAMLSDCISKFKLFHRDGDCITSLRVQKNKERRREISRARSESGKAGARVTNSLKSANAGDNPANAGKIPANGRQNPANPGKGKERKGKENKEDSSTPGPDGFRFSHNGFFDRQLAANASEPEIARYLALVEFLHEKDAEGDVRFANVLRIKKQISYKDYVELKAVQKLSTRSLLEVLEALENAKGKDKNNRDYANVYLTSKAWLKRNLKEQVQ